MDLLGWSVFLGAVFTGSYVQSVTGFALGMIVIAVVGASGVISLPVLTAVASLITMVNVALALKGHTVHINRRIFVWLGVGQIPAIACGVWLLTQLDREAQWLLELLMIIMQRIRLAITIQSTYLVKFILMPFRLVLMTADSSILYQQTAPEEF